MKLSEKIYSMIKPIILSGGIKSHPITKKWYVQVKLSRTCNYVKFRNWWNKSLQGKIIPLPFTALYRLQLGALSKNTEDLLTIYILRD